MIAQVAPFYIFRSLSAPHNPNHVHKSELRNKSILTDPYTTISTSVLATAIFATLLEASYATYLPIYLIEHFEGLRDLSGAHLGAAGLPTLLLNLIPAGIACTTFLFTPPTGLPPTLEEHEYVFDSETAGFFEHFHYNTWGWYSVRQRELMKRTAVAMVLVAGETVMRTWGEIKGVELFGAIGYAGIWSLGVAIVGAVFEWVGGPSG